MAILGYDTKGTVGTVANNTATSGRFSKFTLAAAGTLTELHGWFGAPSTAQRVQLAVYADSGGLPAGRLAYTAPLTLVIGGGDQELKEVGLSVALAAGDYWLGVALETSAGTVIYRESTGGSSISTLTTFAFNPPPNPYGSTGSTGTVKYSVWGVTGAPPTAKRHSRVKVGPGLAGSDLGGGVVQLALAGAAGHTIADEGSAVTQRGTLDFAGVGVTLSDVPATNRTLVVIPGGLRVSASTFSGGPPVSPIDGEVWVGLNVDANGTAWQFRYNAASSSAYKWEFVGGPPLWLGDTTFFAVVSGAWTVRPAGNLLISRAGEYIVQAGMQAFNNSGAQQNYLIAWGKNGVVGPFATGNLTIPAGGTVNVAGFPHFATLAVSDVFNTCMYNASGSGQNGQITSLVTPRRIS